MSNYSYTEEAASEAKKFLIDSLDLNEQNKNDENMKIWKIFVESLNASGIIKNKEVFKDKDKPKTLEKFRYPYLIDKDVGKLTGEEKLNYFDAFNYYVEKADKHIFDKFDNLIMLFKSFKDKTILKSNFKKCLQRCFFLQKKFFCHKKM